MTTSKSDTFVHTGPEGAQSPAGSDMTALRETLEDYTLRFAPRSYRKWGTGVVAASALGGIAYLADFSIGANIGISYGTGNALLGIAVFAVVIVLSGFPLAYYAARYNIDLDLITRGSGFGYYGSVVTNIIFATFTFIFFALEGSIMAQGLQLGLHIPLWLGYAASTLMVIPLVIYGMSALAKLQVWTTPLWLVLMVVPFVYLLVRHPESVGSFFRLLRQGWARSELRVGHVGSRCLSVADRADRRTDRLPALHATPDSGECAPVVGGRAAGRAGVGDLRRDQAGFWGCFWRCTSLPTSPVVPPSPTNRCTSSWRPTPTWCRTGLP